MVLSYVYVMYDEVAKDVSRVFIFKNDDLALRFLKNAIEMPNSPFAINLQDMVLQKIASINTETCEVTSQYPDIVDSFTEYRNDFIAKNLKGDKNVKDFSKIQK